MAKSGATKVVPATQFKAQCLALIDRVAEGKGAVVISKRGRPVAQLVPIGPAPAERPPLVGSMRIVDPDDDLLSAEEDWEASLPERDA